MSADHRILPPAAPSLPEALASLAAALSSLGIHSREVLVVRMDGKTVPLDLPACTPCRENSEGTRLGAKPGTRPISRGYLKKILRATPGHDEPAITAKALAGKAKVSRNRHF